MAQIIQETTGSLDSIGGFKINKPTETQFNPEALYAVNWNGLESVQDLILILASVGFVFSPKHQHWNQIKHLLDLGNPIIPPTQTPGIKLD